MCCFSGEGDGTADDRAGKTACPADNRRNSREDYAERKPGRFSVAGTRGPEVLVVRPVHFLRQVERVIKCVLVPGDDHIGIRPA